MCSSDLSRAMPIFTEVTQIVAAMAVTATLASAMFKPFGRPFKVTNKGLDRSKLTVHGKFAALYGGLFFLSAMGLARAVAADGNAPGTVFNVAWTLVSMVLYLASLLVCFELPRPRKEERFPFRVAARLQFYGADGVSREVDGVTRDLSCNGVALESHSGTPVQPGAVGA